MNFSLEDIDLLLTLEQARPLIRLFLEGLVQIQIQGGFETALPEFVSFIQAHPDLKAIYDGLILISPEETSLRTQIRIGLFLLEKKTPFFAFLKKVNNNSIKACCEFLDQDFTFSQIMFKTNISVLNILVEEVLNLKTVLNALT
jgi:hypothetical protein